MAWEVIFSAQSTRDLERIVERIASDNPAAEQFGLLLILKAESLVHAPEMGPILPQKPNSRFFPVGSYLIIYRPDTQRQMVRIRRFWHAARGTRPVR